MGDLRERLSLERARVGELPPEEVASALPELGALQAALEARLRTVPGTPSPNGQPADDRLLTAVEVAGIYGRSVEWVYRQAKRWPFTRRETRKTLRFSEAGLRRYLADGRRRG